MMHIGIDFDNTIASYHTLFYTLALQYGCIDANIPKDKKSVRNTIRARGGDSVWAMLQREVYGKNMHKATVMPGFMTFLQVCRQKHIEMSIVSHKTKYPTGIQDIDLHKVAKDWLLQQVIIQANGILADHVYFEPSRKDKLKRIGTIGCTHFIDDMEEVLSEPEFPLDVKRILLGNVHDARWQTCKDWEQVRQILSL